MLVVDDSSEARQAARRALEREGFQVTEAKDGYEALDGIAAASPHVVLLDLGMPGMDGVELLRFLADQQYRSPVLIVSGFDRRVLESAFRLGEALGLNMAGPVEKPVRLEVLEAMLNQLKATLVT